MLENPGDGLSFDIRAYVFHAPSTGKRAWVMRAIADDPQIAALETIAAHMLAVLKRE